MPNPSREDLKRRDQRAAEWRRFRRDHLFSQRQLAEELRCCRRTVVAVERKEVVCPRYSLLLRFNDLKAKCAKEAAA
jgi:hypothetical protein